MTDLEVLFVHGALVRDGGWWWRSVAERLLASTGVRSRAVALPSCGDGGAVPGENGLAEDAASLRAELDRVDRAVLVGHSYGGTVIAEGGDHDAVQHLVYITSYLPDVGQAQGDIVGAEPDPVSIAADEDGTLHVDGYDPESFGARFWADVEDESVRADAWDRVVPQGLAAFGTPTTRAAWQGRESTYLVCAEDQSTSLELQRFHAARATHAVELPTSHHPFLSRPDLITEQLERIVRAA